MPGRPRVYKTEGIVLRRRNASEADSVFTLFARDMGKFDAVARGIRKARSHMRGHLEPLCRVRVLVAHGRTLDVFSQAEAIDSYRAIRDDLDRSAVALYCAELIDRFAPEREKLPELYDLAVELLEGLDAGAPLHIARGFEARLLAASGYDLQMDGCASCAAKLPEGEVWFSPSGGGFLCTACRAGGGSGRALSLRAAKVLRYARSAALASLATVRIDDALHREVEAALGDAVRFALEAEPRSARFVHEVADLYPPLPAPAPSGVQS
jgi:DNA repair protein RecO (recombination protein O)